MHSKKRQEHMDFWQRWNNTLLYYKIVDTSLIVKKLTNWIYSWQIIIFVVVVIVRHKPPNHCRWIGHHDCLWCSLVCSHDKHTVLIWSNLIQSDPQIRVWNNMCFKTNQEDETWWAEWWSFTAERVFVVVVVVFGLIVVGKFEIRIGFWNQILKSDFKIRFHVICWVYKVPLLLLL